MASRADGVISWNFVEGIYSDFLKGRTIPRSSEQEISTYIRQAYRGIALHNNNKLRLVTTLNLVRKEKPAPKISGAQGKFKFDSRTLRVESIRIQIAKFDQLIFERQKRIRLATSILTEMRKKVK